MTNVPFDNALETFARAMLPALEQEMRAVLARPAATQPALGPPKGPPDSFYGMLHYHVGWLDADLQPAATANGKRIRPLLCLLACQAAAQAGTQSAQREVRDSQREQREKLSGLREALHSSVGDQEVALCVPKRGAWQRALPAAAAVELLHNFSLIHDDIQDASPTRRGRPTLWKIWGVEQAINSGDAMFALAHLALGRLSDRAVPAPTVVQALRRFDETCLCLTQGQHADMNFETRAEVSVDEYLEMITGKTAVLLALCAELGALVAGAGPAVIGHYAAFGRDLGLAFQVKDDILGIWGQEARTGKSAATDIATRKKTLPVLYALSQSPELRRLYRRPFGSLRTGSETNDDFVRQAVALLDQAGARDFAAARAAHYSQSALDHLEAAEPAGAGGVALYQLAHMLLNRDF